MNMQQVTGLSLLLFLATRPSALAEDAIPHADILGAAKYQRADTNFYGRGDVLRAHPGAVIVSQGAVLKTGDDYFYTPKTKAPKTVYAETLNDWIEPITPPDMPASLGVPNDAMAIREPQGDVQIALPNAPTNFTAVTPNMTFPNGSILKTGAGASVAVLFGGVYSARLMPNSEAAVQQTVTDKTRSAEVDLTTGGVFSKVGTQVGVDGKYEVHTAAGIVSATGGDFVALVVNGRTDVWVAAGKVELNHSDGSKGLSASSDGVGPLKVMRLPAISDPRASVAADTETLSAVMNFVPLADQKLKALRAKKDGGATLSANEEAYLARIKKVPSVIKLALVEPPAPAPVAAAAAKPVPPAPKPKPLVEKPVLAPLPPPTPRPAPTAESPAKPVVAAPEKPVPATPVSAAPAAEASGAAATPATGATVPGTSSTSGRLRAVVRSDGKINFQKVTLTPTEFKARINALVQDTPDQAVMVKAGKTVPYVYFESAVNICRAAQVKNLTTAGPSPVNESPAVNLPAPGLILRPSMGPVPDETTPPPTPSPTAPATATP